MCNIIEERFVLSIEIDVAAQHGTARHSTGGNIILAIRGSARDNHGWIFSYHAVVGRWLIDCYTKVVGMVASHC